MSVVKAIFSKEFKGYFSSPTAYVFMTVYLVLTGWLFFRAFFFEAQASMRYYFVVLPWIFLFLLPAVTMRTWAEEKSSGTLELMLTLPVKDYEVVLGKFLACFFFLALTVMFSFPIPLIVYMYGNPDPGPLIGGYLGALFMGAAYLSIGIFASGLTKNQIVAYIMGIALCFFMFILGEGLVLGVLPRALVPIFEYLGLGSHFHSIGRGVIDTRDLVYYVSVVVFFLFLNVRTVERRKWK